MTSFAVVNYQLKIHIISGMSTGIFSNFSLLFVGFFEGASMLILWIRLKTTAEELQGKNSPETIKKAQRRIWLATVFTFTITTLALSSAVVLCVWVAKVFKDGHVVNHAELGRIVSNFLAIFSAVCALYLVVSLLVLQKTLNEIFGKNLAPDFRNLRQNFVIVVVAYGLYFIFNCIYGRYYKIICQTYIRWIIEFLVQCAFEIGVILPILHLHHTVASTAQHSPQQTQELVKARDSKTLQEDEESEIEDIEFEAEMLSNFELYKRMNPINTGQFAGMIS